MWFAVVVVLVTLARLYVMTQVPLTGDEAYHWQWARHLALGYYDHPPLIAWLIAFSTRAFGDSLFATRLAGPLCAALTTFFVYLLGREVSGSRRVAALAGTLWLVAPLPSIGAMGVIPDTPLLPAWAACVYFLYRAVFAETRTAWTSAGLALGLGILSKLMAFLLLPSLFAFLILSAPHRHWLRRSEPYLFVAAGLIVASPFLWWNATHGWDTFVYQARFRLGQQVDVPLLQTKFLLTFLWQQTLQLFPVIFGLAIAVLFYIVRSGLHGEPRDLFLGTFSGVILLFFTLTSLRARTNGHWAITGYLTIFVAMAWLHARLGRAYRATLAIGVTGAGLTTAAVFAILLQPQWLFGAMAQRPLTHQAINKGESLDVEVLAELYGYEGAAGALARTVAEMSAARPTFVITDSYTLASVLAFYSKLDTHVIRGSIIGRAYDSWDRFESLAGQDAVFVDLAPYGSRPDITDLLERTFARVEPDPPLRLTVRGQAIRPFYLVRCRDFRPAALPTRGH